MIKERPPRREYEVSNRALRAAITGLTTTTNRRAFAQHLDVFARAWAEHLPAHKRREYKSGELSAKSVYTAMKDSTPVAMDMDDSYRLVKDVGRCYPLVKGLVQAVDYTIQQAQPGKQAIWVDAGMGSALGILVAVERGARGAGVEYNGETFEHLEEFVHNRAGRPDIQLIHGDATSMPLNTFNFWREGLEADGIVSETESTAKDEAFELIRLHLSGVLREGGLIVPGGTELAATACYIDSESQINHDAFHRYPGAEHIGDDPRFVQYADLTARKGDPVPEIDSTIELPQPIPPELPTGKKLGVVLRMRIKMSANIPNLPENEKFYLEPNAGEFLGQDWVFPVEGTPTETITKIFLQFPTATSIDLLKARIEGDTIIFYKQPEEKVIFQG